MTNNNETALILEGGGTRGVFTSGVLDWSDETSDRVSLCSRSFSRGL